MQTPPGRLQDDMEDGRSQERVQYNFFQMPDLVEGMEKTSLGATVQDPEYTKEQTECLQQVQFKNKLLLYDNMYKMCIYAQTFLV